MSKNKLPEFKPGIREGLLSRPQDVKDEALLSAILSQEIATQALDYLQSRVAESALALREFLKDLPEERLNEARDVMVASANLMAGLVAVKSMYRVYEEAGAAVNALTSAAHASLNDKPGADEPTEPVPGDAPLEVRKMADDLIFRAGKG